MVTTPKFRKRADRQALRYWHINVDYADYAWENLTRYHHVKYRNRIAKQMKVGKNISAVFRRMFHEMGLAEDMPGTWNPGPLDESYVPDFDGDTIEDGAEGYDQWSDVEDFNDPAQVWVWNTDPRAFRKRFEEMTNGEDLGLWVASRYLVRGTPELYDDSVARFARWERVPAKVRLDQEHREALAEANNQPVEQLSHEGRSHSSYYYYWGRNPSGETVPPEPSDDPPPLLLLAPGPASRRAALLASEASTASRCTSSPDGTFQPKDLVNLAGYARATAHRRLEAWEDLGLVEQEGYGKYRWTVG